MTSKKFGPEDVGITRLGAGKDPSKVSEADWKKVLPGEAFRVARQSGTESPGSGGFDNHFEKGRYVCLCCGTELFNSDSKYWSGCGWPAFSESVGRDANITRIRDVSHGMVRTEVRCKQCDAHLGHVFNDGPKTTGERYCINSLSMAFEKKD
uniref:Peptide-methionine (R)-S-oxide reductase n=1 Tax=Caenorhabditis japonica TaxID=281687 RepID=A0A8R1DJY3_CAEJA